MNDEADPQINNDLPFMEHPDGEFETAVEAIQSAIERLDQIDMQDRWITFCGQGMGSHSESIKTRDILFSGRTVDLNIEQLDLNAIFKKANLDLDKISVKMEPDGKISFPEASPEHLARIFEAIFTVHFQIKPFDGEDDYAVGAEW